MRTPSHNESETIKLACDLIKLKSVTPVDAGCQKLMIRRLESTGFKIQSLPFGNVKNFGQFMVLKAQHYVLLGIQMLYLQVTKISGSTHPFSQP